jgi:hypothetical protein
MYLYSEPAEMILRPPIRERGISCFKLLTMQFVLEQAMLGLD